MANGPESSHPTSGVGARGAGDGTAAPAWFPFHRAADDARRHATELRERLQAARDAAATEDVGGYDERRLIRIKLADKVQPEDVARAAGNVQVVSQEEDALLLAFASDEQLGAFEARLTSLATGERVSYRLLYALQDVDRWTPRRSDGLGTEARRVFRNRTASSSR